MATVPKTTVKKAAAKKVAVKKTAVKKVAAPKVALKKAAPVGQYYRGVGRRKAATAEVRLYPVDSVLEQFTTVNDKDFKTYFGTDVLVAAALAPLARLGLTAKYSVSVLVRGGGQNGQAGATALGVARAILAHDEGHRLPLRAAGMLTRDSRVVERKKYGLKKARRAPQWSKR